MVQFNFDATTVAPGHAGADVIPSGVYDAQITKTEMTPTKDGSGAMLVVTMTVINGDHKGATIVDRLNLQNANAKAVEIAYGTLSAICHVTGVLHMQNTEQLHGRPFKVKVVMGPRSDDPSKMGNETKGYYDIHGNDPSASAHRPGNSGIMQAPAQPQAAPAAPAAPAASAPGTQAWQPNQAPAPTPAAAPAPAPAPQQPAPPTPAPAPAQMPAQPAPAAAPGAVPPWAQQ